MNRYIDIFRILAVVLFIAVIVIVTNFEKTPLLAVLVFLTICLIMVFAIIALSVKPLPEEKEHKPFPMVKYERIKDRDLF